MIARGLGWQVQSLLLHCGLDKALDRSSVVRVVISPCLHQKCRHTLPYSHTVGCNHTHTQLSVYSKEENSSELIACEHLALFQTPVFLIQRVSYIPRPGCSVHTSLKHAGKRQEVRSGLGCWDVGQTISCFVIMQPLVRTMQLHKVGRVTAEWRWSFFSSCGVCYSFLQLHCYGVMHIEIDYSARFISSKALFHAWLTLCVLRSLRCLSDSICRSEEHTAMFHEYTASYSKTIFCHMEGNELVRP